MKCLSIQQPWASLICGGVKDVENRSWRASKVPGRILIHAGRTMRFAREDMPYHYDVLITNAVTCGYVPAIGNMPKGAIIGYADIVGFSEESSSEWAESGYGAEWKWEIANARLFKSPIPYRGRQGLFEVPEIDVNYLPEVYDFPAIKRDGKTLFIPLSYEMFCGLDYYEGVNLFVTEANRNLFADDNLEELPTESVVYINSATGERRQFTLHNYYIDVVYDEDTNKIIVYPDHNGRIVDLITVGINHAPLRIYDDEEEEE